MKLAVFDVHKKKLKEATLPSQFSEEFRPDLIKRAVLVQENNSRQPYGANQRAGMRHSSTLSKRRRKYRGCYGFGISRVNRKILSRRGTRMHWVGAFSPQTRGGRRSHSPKAERILTQKINKVEKRKAIRSAMAATVDKSLVEARGHIVPTEYPFILDNSFESLSKTQDVAKALVQLGFADELKRSAQKKIRAGKGTMRGRKYKRKKGVLIVTAGACSLIKAAKNVPGVDIVPVKSLNAKLLSPGCVPGRVTLWTQAAVDAVQKENLFV